MRRADRLFQIVQILLRGDTGVPYGRVLELFDVIKQLGFKNVDLVISRPKPAPP